MRFIYKIKDNIKFKYIGLFKSISNKRLRKRTLNEKNLELNKNKYKLTELLVTIKTEKCFNFFEIYLYFIYYLKLKLIALLKC